jgi:hypothetical protein
MECCIKTDTFEHVAKLTYFVSFQTEKNRSLSECTCRWEGEIGGDENDIDEMKSETEFFLPPPS